MGDYRIETDGHRGVRDYRETLYLLILGFESLLLLKIVSIVLMGSYQSRAQELDGRGEYSSEPDEVYDGCKDS